MRTTAQLRRRILSRDVRVGLVGAGGPTSSAISAAGFATSPLDVGELDGLVECEVILIGGSGDPDPSSIEATCLAVAEHLRAGRLVILTPWAYPGHTERTLVPTLESGGLRAGSGFLVACAHVSARVGAGEVDFPQHAPIVGGLTPEATGLAALFCEQLGEKPITVGSCRAAEFAALLEWTTGELAAALVNEAIILAEHLGISAGEVVAAARSGSAMWDWARAWPLDGNPEYARSLASKLQGEAGRRFKTLETATEINEQIPSYVAGRIGELLNEVGKPVKGSRILVLGLGNRTRPGGSPQVEIMRQLQGAGAKLAFHDPFVAELPLNGRVLPRAEITERSVGFADLVAILGSHDAYSLDWIRDRAHLLFDAADAFSPGHRLDKVAL